MIDLARIAISEYVSFHGAEALSDDEIVRELRERHLKKPETIFYYHNRRHDPVGFVNGLLRDGYQSRNNPPFSVYPPIDWGLQNEQDVEWQVERNAFFFVDPLLQAFVDTGEERYFDVSKSIMLDWIDYNIIRDEPNRYKWSDIACGVRSSYLGFLLDNLLRREGANANDVKKLVLGAWYHSRKLSDSKYIGGANHVIFQALGLASLCDALPELKGSDRLSEFSRNLLESIIARQYSDEGVHLEHSPYYQYWVYERLSQILRFRWFQNTDIQRLLERIEETFVYFFHPNGELSGIGESSESHVSKFTQMHPYLEYLATNGESGKCPENASAAFPKAGYVILRNSWSVPRKEQSCLIFTGAFHSYSHKQADDLTFEWSEFGEKILVDSGKLSYDFNVERDYVMSPRAHNTIEIDDASYSFERAPYGSALQNWGYDQQVKFVEGSVYHKDFRLTHMRRLFLCPMRWLLVVDFLDSPLEHKYTQWFHFAPGTALEKRVNGIWVNERGRVRGIHVRDLTDSSQEWAIFNGDKHPRLQGWISPSYGKLVPNFAAGLTKSGKCQVFMTLFKFESSSDVKLWLRKYYVDEERCLLVWCSGDDKTEEGVDFGYGRLERYWLGPACR